LAGVGLLVADVARTVGVEVAVPAALGEADPERGTEVAAAVAVADEPDGDVEGDAEGDVAGELEDEGVAPPLQAETVNISATAATSLLRTSSPFVTYP